MELEEYSYGSHPYLASRIFDVHALSNDGFNQYIGSNSYTHKYLSKLTPKILNSFHYNHNVNFKNSSWNDSDLIPQDDQKEENFDERQSKQNLENQENKQNDEDQNINDYVEKEKKEIGYKTSLGFFNNVLNQKIKNSKKEKNMFNKNFMNSTTENFSSCKSNVDLLTRRLNFTSSNFKRTEEIKNNFDRFNKNYLQNINILSSKDFFKNKNQSENKIKRHHDGFESYNIPRLEKKRIDNSKPMNHLAEKVAKSCIGNKKIAYEGPNSNSKMREVCEENDKLEKIILQQTDNNFLKSVGLPEISNMVYQPKLRIKNISQGAKIRHLGKRYNPYNYQAGRDCEPIRRNQFGALFQH